MSHSYSYSFTLTNAKYLASKVATDLKRIKRLYGKPSDKRIRDYESEMILLLKHGYLKKVTYGFQRNGKWIPPTLIYQAKDLEGNQIDDDPGRIEPGQDVTDARFTSYLIYSNAWNQLSLDEQTKFEKELPFQRGGAEEPGIDGYVTSDKTYSSGSKSLGRSSVKKY